mgnify:FL=1
MRHPESSLLNRPLGKFCEGIRQSFSIMFVFILFYSFLDWPIIVFLADILTGPSPPCSSVYLPGRDRLASFMATGTVINIFLLLIYQVETMQQLRQVEESDLEDIRMRADDIAKLKKHIKKEFPQSAFGKLKKVRWYSYMCVFSKVNAKMIGEKLHASKFMLEFMRRCNCANGKVITVVFYRSKRE